MASFISVVCPCCGDKESIIKFGRSANDKQRFQCQTESCSTKTFILDHERKGWKRDVKESVIEMTLNGSGIRDISRVLGICTETVMSEIKKKKIFCKRQISRF